MVVASLSAPASAQRVTAYISADSVTVGERFTLSLVAEHNFMAAPFFPAPGDSLFGDLVALKREVLPARYGGTARPGTRIDSVTYEVATFALDTAYVPPVPVLFAINEDTLRAASQPIFVPVISLVPPGAQDIQDLAPLAEFPAPVWPWVLLATAALLLLGAFVYGLRRKQKAPPPAVEAPPPPPARPYEEAIERLNRLETNEDLAEPAHAKLFYVILSDTLRTYLERRAGVPALESTTRELLATLQQRAHRLPLGEEVMRCAAGVLELSDLAKFAEHRPQPREGKTAIRQARAVIESVEVGLNAPPLGGNGQAPPVPPPAPAPALPAEAAKPPRQKLAAWMLGSAGALVVVLMAWRVNMAMPTALALAGYFGARYVAGPRQRPMVPAFAVQTGHYLWILLGYALASSGAASPALAIAEVLVMMAGLAWLLWRPGLPPVLLLTVVQVLGLATNGISFVALDAQRGPLFVHVALRLVALATLWWGWQELRRRGHEDDIDR